MIFDIYEEKDQFSVAIKYFLTHTCTASIDAPLCNFLVLLMSSLLPNHNATFHFSIYYLRQAMKDTFLSL